MKLTEENIRDLVFRFVKVAQRFGQGTNPTGIAGKVVGLERVDSGFQLVTTERIGINALDRRFVTWLVIPEEITADGFDDFILQLAILLAQKLTASKRAINAGARRDPESVREASRKAIKKRWNKDA